MSATRRPLLLAFAGGGLSGAALILSGVGVISIWRGTLTVSPSPHGARERTSESAAPHVAAADAPRERPHAAPVANIDSDELGPEPAAAHASNDAVVEHPAEPGSSVADVLTRLEAAYRQGLVNGAHANADQAALPGAESPPGPTEVLPANTPSGPHDVPAHDAVVATADATPPAPTAAATPPAAPMQAAVVGVPVQPIVVALAAPPANAAPEAYPAPVEAGAGPGFAAQDATGSHDGYGSVTQNIHVDNLHQGDVYNQQVQVMQYMQLLAGSPYGNYAGYAPVPAAPTHHHNATASAASPFSTPQLPVAAPPFPSWYSSLTNPANPSGYQHRAGRAFR